MPDAYASLDSPRPVAIRYWQVWGPAPFPDWLAGRADFHSCAAGVLVGNAVARVWEYLVCDEGGRIAGVTQVEFAERYTPLSTTHAAPRPRDSYKVATRWLRAACWDRTDAAYAAIGEIVGFPLLRSRDRGALILGTKPGEGTVLLLPGSWIVRDAEQPTRPLAVLDDHAFRALTGTSSDGPLAE